MSSYDTCQQKSSGTDPRPTYLALGRDAEGREHVYRTFAEEVVVIRDGQRVHIEQLGNRSVDDWMAFVRERTGWMRTDFGMRSDWFESATLVPR